MKKLSEEIEFHKIKFIGFKNFYDHINSKNIFSINYLNYHNRIFKIRFLNRMFLKSTIYVCLFVQLPRCKS